MENDVFHILKLSYDSLSDNPTLQEKWETMTFFKRQER